MPRMFRATALLAALSVAACATGPGPAEIMYRSSSEQCTAGNQSSCQHASSLYSQVLAEKAQRQAQNDAAAAAVAAGLLGVLAGAAVGAASAPRYYQPVYFVPGRRW